MVWVISALKLVHVFKIFSLADKMAKWVKARAPPPTRTPEFNPETHLGEGPKRCLSGLKHLPPSR